MKNITDKPLELFPYQKKLLRESLKQVRESDKHSVFVVAAPGSGKTVMMAELAKRFTDLKKNVLFFVHRIEIVKQAEATFKRQGVDMDYVKIGMVQTMTRHIDELKETPPTAIFVDEAHHAAAETYVRILNSFPDAIKFYFTATPWRGDGKGFEELANNDDIVFGPSVKELIKEGYLSDFDYYLKSMYDRSSLKFSNYSGDYTEKSIREQTSKIDNSQIVDTYKELGRNKPAIVYASTINQSKAIVKKFNENGISAYHLDGITNNDERAEVLERFKNNEIKVISNVQIFTEGVDLPDAAVALIVRPTRSIALFYQFAMRVLRKKEGKRATIIDFAGVANDLGLPDADFEWSLLSRNVADDILKTPKIYECPECHFVNSAESVIRKDNTRSDGTLQVDFYCSQCGALIDSRTFDPNNATEQVELKEINDREEFSQDWFLKAKIQRNQSLAVNALILRKQDVDNRLSNIDIYTKLLRLYLPDFSRNASFSKVKSIVKFKDSEIKRMIINLNAPENDISLFNDMFEARRKIIIEDYARKTDIANVDENDAFKSIMISKISMIKREANSFGDIPSKENIMKQLANNIMTNVDSSLDGQQKLAKFKVIKEKMVKLDIVSKADGEKLFNFAIDWQDAARNNYLRQQRRNKNYMKYKRSIYNRR